MDPDETHEGDPEVCEFCEARDGEHDDECDTLTVDYWKAEAAAWEARTRQAWLDLTNARATLGFLAAALEFYAADGSYRYAPGIPRLVVEVDRGRRARRALALLASREAPLPWKPEAAYLTPADLDEMAAEMARL